MLSKAKECNKEPSMRALPAIDIQIDVELANAPYEH